MHAVRVARLTLRPAITRIPKGYRRSTQTSHAYMHGRLPRLRQCSGMESHGREAYGLAGNSNHALHGQDDAVARAPDGDRGDEHARPGIIRPEW